MLTSFFESSSGKSGKMLKKRRKTPSLMLAKAKTPRKTASDSPVGAVVAQLRTQPDDHIRI
jgi:hypothetical protein